MTPINIYFAGLVITSLAVGNISSPCFGFLTLGLGVIAAGIVRAIAACEI